jgi:DNA invertase Pin-like site-specific DNA recombinase
MRKTQRRINVVLMAAGIGMDASGESAITIAATLGVSRATVYRLLAEEPDRSD